MLLNGVQMFEDNLRDEIQHGVWKNTNLPWPCLFYSSEMFFLLLLRSGESNSSSSKRSRFPLVNITIKIIMMMIRRRGRRRRFHFNWLVWHLVLENGAELAAGEKGKYFWPCSGNQDNKGRKQLLGFMNVCLSVRNDFPVFPDAHYRTVRSFVISHAI